MSLWRVAGIAALLSLLIVAFCAAYVSVEQPLYAWDFASYWHVFQAYGEQAANGDWSWPRRVLETAREKDYNATPVVPLLPIYLIFGGSRTAYISGVAVLYLLPTVAILALVTRRAIADRQALPFWAIFLIALTFIPLWRPTMRGYLDIVGLIGLTGATWLLFRSRFLQQAPIRTGLMIGLCLWTAFLFRRWYAFSIVAFFGAAVIAGLMSVVFNQNSDLKGRLLRLIGGLFAAGVLFLTLIIAVQSELVIRVLHTSYADIYDAYQLSQREHLVMLTEWLTPLGLATAAIGLVAAIARRNEKLVFCVIGAVITYVLFTRTQRFGPHHFLPVAMWSFVLTVAGFNELMRRLQGRPRRLAQMGLVAGSLSIFALITAPSAVTVPAIASAFVSRPDLKPLRLDGFDQYVKIAGEIEASLKPSDRVVLFASSRRLSDSLLSEIRPSLGRYFDLVDHVDKFRMFTFDLLRADVALAASPDQTHLLPERQITVTVPGQLLLQRKGFGRAFEFERSYELPGMRLSQFRRVRGVTADEAADLLAIFAMSYADWPAAYRRSLSIPFALRRVSSKAPWGHGSIGVPNTIKLHPDVVDPTSVTIPFDARLGAVPTAVELRLGDNSSPNCWNADGVLVSVSAAGETIWKGDLLSSATRRIVLPPATGAVELFVDKRGNDACDLTYAEFEIGGK